MILFPKLQSVSLKELPCLMNLCDTENRVELQQLVELSLDGLPNITAIFPDDAMQPNAFFNKQVVIPKLETLKISSMEKLKQIWPSEITTTISEEEVNDISMVRVVEVQGCNELVNLFPTNPMPLLLNLENLRVKNCGSIKALFNIDLGRVGEIEEVSSLRSIHAVNLKKLEQVWRIKGADNSHPISGFQAVENIRIHECFSFRDIFTPKNTNIDMRAAVDINTQNSRDYIFKEALKSLKSNETHMMGLCGMGGVGKTHMMERLEKEVKDSRMFYWVVKVVVGRNTDLAALQHVVAEKTGGALTTTTTDARAELLNKRFVETSQGGEKKILMILDDVWRDLDLKNIGLRNPLPDGFKLLMTSRNLESCKEICVDSIFVIGPLDDVEAKSLFFEIVEVSEDDDPHLYKIGEDIVRRCGNLPIALKTIAGTLKGHRKDDCVWREALSRLRVNDMLLNVWRVFEISYDLRTKDEQEIFLLSSLFPEDFDISVEELTRYAWGLKLLSKVHTIAKARQQVKICVNELISVNLLAESDRVGCVKMHDLTRDFALDKMAKVKQGFIINHDHMWLLKEDAYKSIKRILLKCTGLSRFPEDFNCPNLAFLKLMDGDEPLMFPEDFYKSMEKLQVLSYEEMLNPPLLPKSGQCSTHLRTLSLHGCELISDWSAIGYLVNLEVLSFADSCVKTLPTVIGKLKMLKLLDLTGCLDLCVEDGVFQGLDKLEELYMSVSGQKAIQFTDANCVELQELSVKLSALEVEFFNNKAQPRNISFKNLERFKISIGRLLKDNNDIYAYQNTLKLVTKCRDLLECKIDELFRKTEELHLEVTDMKRLTDVITRHPLQESFYNLRVLVVVSCEELRYLFTGAKANGLRQLERLTVSGCPVLESLIHGDESGSDGVIMFPKLKSVSLKKLPCLMSLCDTDNRVVLLQLVELTLKGLPNFTAIYPDDAMQPYAFFNNQVYIPNIQKLRISFMEKLMQIWPCEVEDIYVSMLREIEVKGCDSLVNLFPCNPLPLLNHLQGLEVIDCGSIQVLFNMELQSGAGADNINEHTSSLRYISVRESENVREIWRIKDGRNIINNSSSGIVVLLRCFEDVYKIDIKDCKRFRDIFTTPKNISFDIRADVIIGTDDA